MLLPAIIIDNNVIIFLIILNVLYYKFYSHFGVSSGTALFTSANNVFILNISCCNSSILSCEIYFK